ncbi:hypothetical protein Bbelb_217790 [Branchiostoma belcheri]|nr:hypothetical protein Bbelb_217790 [Branchiostoma belcheri]
MECVSARAPISIFGDEAPPRGPGCVVTIQQPDHVTHYMCRRDEVALHVFNVNNPISDHVFRAPGPTGLPRSTLGKLHRRCWCNNYIRNSEPQSALGMIYNPAASSLRGHAIKILNGRGHPNRATA